MNNKKIVILDPACHTEYGHNVQSCLRFAKFYESKGYDIFFVAAGKLKLLKEHSKNVISIPQLYPFLYSDESPSRIFNVSYRCFFEFMKVAFGFFLDPLVAWLSRFILFRKLKKLDLSKDDVVFMPSCDFYYACALAKLVVQEKIKCKLHFRFIGVLENASFSICNKRHYLFKMIRNTDLERVRVSAEVSRYADFLSNVLGRDVGCKPYPLCSFESAPRIPNKKFSKEHPLTFFLPGKAREDKGSLEVVKIARACIDEYGMKVKIIAQSFPEGSRFYNKLFSKKSNYFPNIEIVDSKLSHKKLEELINGSHIILLPYDPNNYWWRGSAIFYDSIEKRKLVFGRGGVALVDEFSKSGILEDFCNLPQLIGLIGSCLEKDSDFIYERAEDGYQRYIKWYNELCE